jgi:hypothetical protein
MPARYAPAIPPAADAAPLSADRLQRLDAALRDMAQTCPLPNGIEALAQRLEHAAALSGSRRRQKAIRRAG